MSNGPCGAGISPKGMAVPSVLIIDDDPGQCQLLAEYVGMHGWDAVTASTAEEVLAQIDLEPAVVVLDLIMPQLDGVTVLTRMRNQGSRSSVILVSGYDRQLLESTGLLAEGYRLNFIGVMFKPIAFDDFSRMLQEAVRISKNCGSA